MSNMEDLLTSIRATTTAPNDGQPVDAYDKFLEVLLSGRHPSHAHLTWNGDVCQISFSQKFRQYSDEPTARVRRRAHRYFAQFQPDERRLMDFDVKIEGDVPVYAIIKVRPEAMGVLRLGTARLRELADEFADKSLTYRSNGNQTQID